MKEEKKTHFFRTIFFILILLIVLVILYGRFIETNYIFVNEYEIKNKNIPNSFNNFKIAHFSDVLYKDNDDLERLKDVKTKINDKKVDMIIFSGDLIKKDSNVSQKEIDKITKLLTEMNAKYGKYYVTGDNDNKNELY